MAEDVLTKRKRLTAEAAAMADEPIGIRQRLNPMRPIMKEMDKIKPGPDPTFDATRRRK